MAKMTMCDTFKEKVMFLDAFLTGKKWREVCHTTKSQLAVLEPEGFAFDGLYYLSDGGYSRLGWNGFELFLASESRDEVKERWDMCMELRDDITQILRSVDV